MGVNELVFNKLNRHINYNTEYYLGWRCQQDQKRTNQAGSKCPHIWNEGEQTGQKTDQTRIWQPEQAECSENQSSKNDGFHTLSGQKFPINAACQI